MAVSKRLRYEVLRRDNHQCRYCGAAAPDATLTVDHVIPTALGGGDDPSNLVTACMPCNSGKSATIPDGPLVRDVDESALRWSHAMAAAAEVALADLGKREEAYAEFDDAWHSWSHGRRNDVVPRPPDWRRSIDSFTAAGLPMPILLDALQRAMESTKVSPDGTWRYMCGIAWSRVAEIQKAAQRAADRPDAPVTLHQSAVTDFAYELLDGLFRFGADYYLDTARAEAGDVPPDELHTMAVRYAIDQLRAHDTRMTQAVEWAVELLPDEIAQPLRLLAEAHCTDLLGQYSDSDVAGCMIFLAKNPGKREIVENRLREESGGGD